MKILTEKDFLHLKNNLREMDEQISLFKEEFIDLAVTHRYRADVILNALLSLYADIFEHMRNEKIIGKDTIGFDKVKRIYEAIIKEVKE